MVTTTGRQPEQPGRTPLTGAPGGPAGAPAGPARGAPGGPARGGPVRRIRARLGSVGSVAPVGAGLGLVGLAAYVVMALAGHTLPPRDYAAAASMFLLTAIVGPGVFAAVEQQTNHEVSARLAAATDPRAAARSAALVCAGLIVVMVLLVLALAPVLVPRAFAGHTALLAATVLAVLGAAGAYLLRGIFAGQRRYRWYGLSLAAEGLGRLVPCAALVAFGAGSADRFGFAFALGCVVAALVSLPGLRRRPLAAPPSVPGSGPVPGPGAAPAVVPPSATGSTPAPVRLSRLAAAIGLLACASSLTLLVTNLAPVVLTSRLGAAPADAEVSASFVSLFLLARIPLFLFAPVQAFLLPALSAAAQRGELAVVRSRVRLALLGVLAVGLPGILVAALAGPWASRVLFGAPIALPRTVAALLGLSTVAMMTAAILQPALVALRRNRAATLAWTVSSVVFVGLLFAPTAIVGPLAATVIAQLVAPTLVTVLMLVALRRELRARAAAAGRRGPANAAVPEDQNEPTVTNSL